MVTENDARKYTLFYSTSLGGNILEQEAQFISERLAGCRTILSIGCGPAIVEARLQKNLPDTTIIGLDSSKEMMTQAPKGCTLVQGDALNLAFKDGCFDAVIFVTALEFIQNNEKALQETSRVLRDKGKLLVLMLNPDSWYFHEKFIIPTSYIRHNIKHKNIKEIRQRISEYFLILSQEYFLGITPQGIVTSKEKSIASLSVFMGEKR
ncbi:MAG: methyltransferase domain-containing protein [Candidatus Thermoplasmatota archaeon]|nr:methyltransferase domain-containing protein [Candidatus Thermoplasmatota archaeon]